MTESIIGYIYKDKKPDAIYSFSMPPSINMAYSNTNNPTKPRVKSKKYVSWIKSATSEFMLQKKSYIYGNVAVIYSFYVPDKRVRDCANYEKCLSDFLVKNGIIQDDSKIRFNAQEWLDTEPNGSGVIVKIFKVK